MKIQGSVALVTGANRGIGKALVTALVDAGASKVYAAARDTSSIVGSDKVIPLTLDVTDAASVAAAAEKAKDVTLLINTLVFSKVAQLPKRINRQWTGILL